MAFDAFLFIKTIKGESPATFKAKPNGMTDPPIQILSFSFGASNPVNIGPGTMDVATGRVDVSSLSLMKVSDDTSPLLFQACAKGHSFTDATLVLRKAVGKDKSQEIFLQYDMKNVYVESIQWSGASGGDDTPGESISLAFTEITITNYKQDPTGNALTKGNGASWDLRKVEQKA